jgi:hypothetical protein
VSSTRSTGQIITGIYIAVIVALIIWFPLITLHGYRVWWVDVFYGTFALSVVSGSISHYLTARQHQRDQQVR